MSSIAGRRTVVEVPTSRTPGQRAGLTSTAVLTAARELLDERGVAALSMRTLAARLGVRPNTLYSHVPSKDALVDELLDETLAAVRPPPPDVADPLAGVHALMRSTYGVLLAHADLVPLYLARRGARGPHAQRLGAVMLALLDRSGISGPPAREALHVLVVYTIGAAAFATRSPLADAPIADEDHQARFDQGLRWIIAGISSPPEHG
jgi:TetR/AcrR family tetracycline transcriptional repressor